MMVTAVLMRLFVPADRILVQEQQHGLRPRIVLLATARLSVLFCSLRVHQYHVSRSSKIALKFELQWRHSRARGALLPEAALTSKKGKDQPSTPRVYVGAPPP